MHETILTVEVANDLQYEAAKTLGVKHIYYRNIINRNNASYINMEDEVLVEVWEECNIIVTPILLLPIIR